MSNTQPAGDRVVPRCRWHEFASDECETGELMTPEETDRYLAECGLPHKRSHEFRPVSAISERPEFEELCDSIFEYGLELGRSQRGRDDLLSRPRGYRTPPGRGGAQRFGVSHHQVQ